MIELSKRAVVDGSAATPSPAKALCSRKMGKEIVRHSDPRNRSGSAFSAPDRGIDSMRRNGVSGANLCVASDFLGLAMPAEQS